MTKGDTMPQAKTGDTVRVHYTGMLDNGEVFDSSKDREPLQVTLGVGEVIPGFEQAIIGMSEGETVTVIIPSTDAYGAHEPDMVAVVSAGDFPENLDVQVGQMYEIPQQDDRIIRVTVTDITGDNVTLDANHPLAGKDLTFEITLLEFAPDTDSIQ